MKKQRQHARMRVRRMAQARARAERKLRKLAWQLGITPHLLRASLERLGNSGLKESGVGS